MDVVQDLLDDVRLSDGRFGSFGLPPVLWTPKKGAIMRWEPCNENEDLERSSDEKTSAVHIMSFELDDEMIMALREHRTATNPAKAGFFVRPGASK